MLVWKGSSFRCMCWWWFEAIGAENLATAVLLITCYCYLHNTPMAVSLQILAELKPQGLKVVGGMPFVRNSVGEGEAVR